VTPTDHTPSAAVLFAIAALLLGPQLLPAADEEPFDYFRNSWNVVGLKDYRHGARITPDNELLLSGKTLVQVRVGGQLAPLSRKQVKLALEGWMPIMLVRTHDGPVHYQVTYWATPLPSAQDPAAAYDWPTEGENFLCWIMVRATNTSDRPAEAKAQVGPNPALKPLGHPQPQAEPKQSAKHTRRYTWSWKLGPGESAEAAARYPFFPVDDPQQYDDANPRDWLQRTADYWRGVMSQAARIEVPCRKATEAMRAAHVCQLIANDHGELHGGEGFYDTFYIRDGAYQVMELEEAGLMDTAARAIEFYLKRQRPDGRFESQANQFDANGQAVWALWQYARITGDRAFLARAYPQMLRAVRWTIQARRSAPEDSPFAGVLPAAPADGECLWGGKHHIVGYDLWNLRGMLCTADAARILGKTDEARWLLAEAAAYRAAIDAAWKRTGLAHFPPSWETVGTHWGNTETLWPTELFAADDPRVAALSRFVRQKFAGGFIEGTIQWKGTGKVEAIHPYMGAYTTMTDLVRGRDEQVVEDFYWYLLHTTAAHAFPEGIYYRQRIAWNNTIPHVTGASNYAVMLRHMLVHEAGRELHLLAAVPDWWLAEGQTITVLRAPTHFGELDLTVRGTDAGVKVELHPPQREPPERIVLHLPKSRPLLSPLESVEVVVRRDQQQRWDFPAVIERYHETAGPWARAIPGLIPLPLGSPVDQSRCVELDLTKAANTDPFTAPFGVPNPGKYLFSGLRVGEQTVAGVPFRIIDPKENHGRALVVLHSPKAPADRRWPREVEIPVGRRGKQLFFLGNVHGWDSHDPGSGAWGAVAEYVIHYADGTTQTVPLVTGRTIDDWALAPEADEVVVGPRGDPWHLNVLGVTLRDAVVVSVTLRDLGTPAAPVLAAVTLVE